MLGLDAPSKVEATLKLEPLVCALEDTLIASLGLDDSQVRSVLGWRLREPSVPRSDLVGRRRRSRAK
jgi:hypothetical protein